MKVKVLSWEFDGGNYDIISVTATDKTFADSVKKLMEDNMSFFDTYAEAEEVSAVKKLLKSNKPIEAIKAWNEVQYEWDSDDMMFIRFEEFEVVE